eukprot:TRINITY_DN9859_c0_g1_i3.p1 TRINITY_DN9859_c0_g1~~TRINITY_DN9859_c0_g1_i3.p1  ORF type:complete len:465 (-),score=196.54 TRINITY_DN9859_c0_g1_i3:440-1834(-)
MFLFACLVGWLREELREGVLWFFRNPNADDFDPFKEMLEVSSGRHARRILVSSVMYAMIVIIIIWAPIQLCNLLLPLLPYDVWFREIYEVPLDLLVFHIVVPVTLDYVHPTRGIRKCVMWWFRQMGRLLDLTSYLFGEQPLPNAGPMDPVPWNRPANFGWRVTLLVVSGFASAFLVSLLLMAVPVSIGRALVFAAFGMSVSDLYNVAVGSYLIWACVALARFVSTSLRATELRQAATTAASCLLAGSKWALLTTLWLGVVPFLFGLFFDLAVLVPIRTSSSESPVVFVYHDWAIGILYLKVWYRIVMSEAVPVNKFRLVVERIKRDGFMNLNLKEAVRDLVLPLLMPTVALLSAPYVAIRGLLPLVDLPLRTQAAAFRFGFLATVLLLASYHVVKFVVNWYPRFRQAVIDDLYLIGKKLNNFDGKASPVVAAAPAAPFAADPAAQDAAAVPGLDVAPVPGEVAI